MRVLFRAVCEAAAGFLMELLLAALLLFLGYVLLVALAGK